MRIFSTIPESIWNDISRFGGIYAIENVVSGKVYIGSAINFRHRWRIHLRQLRNNRHHSRYLQRSWNKHGEPAFRFIIIEPCDRDVLLRREQDYISSTKCHLREFGYNVSPSSRGSLGIKRSEETKRKLSLINLGKKMPLETRLKISQGNKGRKLSEYQKQTLLKYSLGVKRSPEARARMSAERTGRKINLTPEGRAKLKRKRGPLSEETKKKISMVLKGKTLGRRHSEETKLKMSISHKKFYETDESRRLHSEKMKLLRRTPEERRLQSIRLKQFWDKKKGLIPNP